MFSVTTFPNPFDQLLTISVMSKIAGDLKIQIRNEKGELVKTLVDSKIKNGTYDYTWSRTNEKSGVYFVISQIGNVIKTNKVVIQ
jgi:hypothetical protein